MVCARSRRFLALISFTSVTVIACRDRPRVRANLFVCLLQCNVVRLKVRYDVRDCSTSTVPDY